MASMLGVNEARSSPGLVDLGERVEGGVWKEVQKGGRGGGGLTTTPNNLTHTSLTCTCR